MDRWLDELDRTPAFCFDSITQLRMDTWSRGRATLVGDAGYSPGPAVGGSTSLAVLGAYVLAGELARRTAITSGPSPPTSARWRNTYEPATRPSRALLRLTTKSGRLYDAVRVEDYAPMPGPAPARPSA
ncbi:hypothetical protein [Streptomyces griseofuscus]|uniref:hypothetical protein n=1 Tax=Streptomyces griseofuscus TaxID=146922 RepID=UPI003F4D5A7B